MTHHLRVRSSSLAENVFFMRMGSGAAVARVGEPGRGRRKVYLRGRGVKSFSGRLWPDFQGGWGFLKDSADFVRRGLEVEQVRYSTSGAGIAGRVGFSRAKRGLQDEEG